MLGTERMLRWGYRLINVYLILQIISMRLFMRGISTRIHWGSGRNRPEAVHTSPTPRQELDEGKRQQAFQKGKGPVLANRNGPFLRSEAYCLPPTV